jgi:hypothetical protein
MTAGGGWISRASNLQNLACRSSGLPSREHREGSLFSCLARDAVPNRGRRMFVLRCSIDRAAIPTARSEWYPRMERVFFVFFDKTRKTRKFVPD